MAFSGGYNYDDSGEERIMLHDLRQMHAEIIGLILKEILIARQQKNYPVWFDLLDDLHTEINHKLKPEEIKRYNEQLDITLKTIQENQQSYIGKTGNAEQNRNIKLALKNFEMMIKQLMERHKMFGAKEEAELM